MSPFALLVTYGYRREENVEEAMNHYNVRRRRRAIVRAEKVLVQLAGSAEIHIEFVMESRGMEVSEIRYYDGETHGYPVCPGCGYGMEREYQNYCEVCGQRLLWHLFAEGKVTVKRLMGMK